MLRRSLLLSLGALPGCSLLSIFDSGPRQLPHGPQESLELAGLALAHAAWVAEDGDGWWPYVFTSTPDASFTESIDPGSPMETAELRFRESGSRNGVLVVDVNLSQFGGDAKVSALLATVWSPTGAPRSVVMPYSRQGSNLALLPPVLEVRDGELGPLPDTDVARIRTGFLLHKTGPGRWPTP